MQAGLRHVRELDHGPLALDGAEHVRPNHAGPDVRFNRAAQPDETRPHRTQEFLSVGWRCCGLVKMAAQRRRATRRRQCPIPDP